MVGTHVCAMLCTTCVLHSAVLGICNPDSMVLFRKFLMLSVAVCTFGLGLFWLSGLFLNRYKEI